MEYFETVVKPVFNEFESSIDAECEIEISNTYASLNVEFFPNPIMFLISTERGTSTPKNRFNLTRNDFTEDASSYMNKEELMYFLKDNYECYSHTQN